MRLFLLPVSTRRALLHAQRLNVTTTTADRNYVDKGASWAAAKWAQWEKLDRGWQRKVVDYGNQAFRRIAFEEWGLKSVPPLSARRRSEEIEGREKVELVFPSKGIDVHKAEGLLRTLATERQALHRQRLIWCFIGMPISAPFALVPVIPNLPFFYLVYRAWSHWRALAGGKHIQWLVENKLILPSPSEELDRLYEQDGPAVQETSDKEQALLTVKQVRNFSSALDVPALEIELERAIWQVENAGKKSEAQHQKADQQKAAASKEEDKKEQ